MIDEEKKIEMAETASNTSEEKTTITDLERDVMRFRDQWMRAVADGQNAEKRMEKEKVDAVKYAVFSFAKDIVTIADYMESALKAVPEDQRKDNALLQGVSMTLEQLRTIFKRFHVEKIQVAVGDAPDPAYHQVMEEKENATVPANTVSHILQDGYLLHDRLVRPALVAVSSGPGPKER